MKLGGFGFLADYPKIQNAGYDYAELDMPEIEALSEEKFSSVRDQIWQTGFPVLTGARILPITEPLFFVDGFRPTSLKDYLRKSCQRSAAVGMKKVILGNGKARSLAAPEDRAKESVFVEFLRMLADIAGENQLELILEPLGPKYSNYINTISEAVEMLERVGLPNVFTMADLRHIVGAKESLEDVITYRPYIHHIHIDYPLSYPERVYPSASDGYDYSKFLTALKRSGYNDTLTIEADIPSDWGRAHDGAAELLSPVL